ncbi:hypothetical protein CVT24_003010 [Panaeolus cyanescens]|uniref:Ketoreductase (KR) domain-containing protein n=1 Tax=Panaeolus cyanescens TaxID=181874 RepID=A0A409VFU5_9AGAR|nr:hypothetical protein CVT24_003010 [Panaeolus cyanescens]
MSSPTVYFITGANRSIGLALVKELVKKSDVFVFAGARKLSPSLEEVISSNSDKVAFVTYVAADEVSNQNAAKVVGDKFGRVDVVLGVAGISDYMGPAEETPAAAFNEHFRVNVTGILILYQAFASLLKKSASPKFIPFSSGAASLTAYIHLPAGYTCYGASKVALNYLARKIHFENEWITCFPLSPGIVQTDMAIANRSMDKTGSLAPVQDAMAVSPEVAGTLLVGIVESATRETHGGEFINLDGSKIPW